VERQIWRRLGHVFAADGRADWMVSHASYPTPLVLDASTVRVFFSPRDAQNRSSIAWLDLRIENGRHAVLQVAAEPLLRPGVRGAFDDSGVSVSCVLAEGGSLSVYYLGWSIGVTVPFRNFIGLAQGSLDAVERVSLAPVLDRSAEDPFTLGYPWVVRDGGAFRMWHGSHLEWGPQWLEMRHALKSARSADGRVWRRDGRIALAPLGGEEFALSRPCVLRKDGLWHMWYSRRFPEYRLGYARSPDGETWQRCDDSLQFAGPAAAWEAAASCYAAVFDLGGRRYMLYNGNGYGRTGFGLAVLEEAA
jgi:hypothetical protein